MADEGRIVSVERFLAVRERRQVEAVRPAVPAFLRSPFPVPEVLTAREVEHRQRMLAHLNATAGATRTSGAR